MSDEKKKIPGRFFAYAWAVVLLSAFTAFVVFQPEIKEWRFQRFMERTEYEEYPWHGFASTFNMVTKMYAMEDGEEMYPPLTPYGDLWMFDIEAMYPEYLLRLGNLVARDHPRKKELLAELTAIQESGDIDWERVTQLAAQSFVYVPWAVDSLDQLPALAERRFALTPEELDSDIVVAGAEKWFYRLREGVERYLITDLNDPGAMAMSQSDIFLVFETLEVAKNKRRRERAAFTLYMDGHMETMSVADVEKAMAALYPDGVPGVGLDE